MRYSTEEIIQEACSGLEFDYSKLSLTSYFTTTEMLRWLNEAQSEWVKETKCLRYRWSLATAANTQEYPFNPDASILEILGMTLDGLPLIQTTTKDLDIYDANWRYGADGRTDLPIAYYFCNVHDSEIGFYPCPNAIYTGVLEYVELPPKLTQISSTTYSKIDDAWHDYFIDYVLYKGFKKKRLWDAAAVARNSWKTHLLKGINTYRVKSKDKVHCMSGPEESGGSRILRGMRYPSGYGPEL